jgi:SAM-dependent methyltransferase
MRHPDAMHRLPLAALAVLACAAASPAGAIDDLPYATTPDNVTVAMLELAKVGPEDYVIDLGSGDGRIVITAARRFGARGLGVDIDAGLVEGSQQSAQRAGVADRAEFRVQDLFLTDLSRATVITLYLLPAVNLQLRPALLALKPGTRIVSHDWDMGAWKPDQTMKIENPRKTSLAHLWVVPARVAGLWCGIGAAHGTRLELQQEFQKARGILEGAGGRRSFETRIESTLLTSPKGRGGSISMKLEGERLRVTRANGAFARWREASFDRPTGRECV